MNYDEYQILFRELEQKYQVDNLISEETRLIFILESPHIDELKNEAPVSGLSGKAMSKVILGTDYKEALGVITKANMKTRNNERLNKIGIMNICRIPMQFKAYEDIHIQKEYGLMDKEKHKEFIDTLEYIRVHNKTEYKDNEKNLVQQVILNTFREELRKITHKKVIFVPCGKTAQKFFQLANIATLNEGMWGVLEGVPHPSYGNWAKQKYKEEIKRLKDLL